jgi:hypothetical protein
MEIKDQVVMLSRPSELPDGYRVLKVSELLQNGDLYHDEMGEWQPVEELGVYDFSNMRTVIRLKDKGQE